MSISQAFSRRMAVLGPILLMGLLMIAYNNCGNDVQFGASNEKPNGINTDLGDLTDDDIEDVVNTCANGNRQTQDFSFSYQNPQNQSCNFGQGDNLTALNGFFRARIEQSKTFTLPAGATLCDIDFTFARQNMLYDDHIIFAYDRVVLASSFDFTNDLSKVAGMSVYNWADIAGDDWDGRKQLERVYCLGAKEGLSTCNMPGHDQQGFVDLDFDQKIFQTITAADRNRSTHEFLVVSIGDNDPQDCEIAPINFTVRVSYVK